MNNSVLKIPFNTAQFVEVFKHYNEAVFPLQIIFVLFGMLAFYFAIKSTFILNKSINIFLPLFGFGWEPFTT